jgi:hypothetical protein
MEEEARQILRQVLLPEEKASRIGNADGPTGKPLTFSVRQQNLWVPVRAEERVRTAESIFDGVKNGKRPAGIKTGKITKLYTGIFHGRREGLPQGNQPEFDVEKITAYWLAEAREADDPC